MQHVETSVWARLYLKSVAALLVITAVAKATMVFGQGRLLDAPSPVFGFLSNRALFGLTAVIEIVVAAFALSYLSRPRVALIAVAWLATVFVGYRLALWAAGFHGSCDCLGSLPGLVHLDANQADWIAGGILVYLLVGSYATLAWWLTCPSKGEVAVGSPPA